MLIPGMSEKCLAEIFMDSKLNIILKLNKGSKEFVFTMDADSARSLSSSLHHAYKTVFAEKVRREGSIVGRLSSVGH